MGWWCRLLNLDWIRAWWDATPSTSSQDGGSLQALYKTWVVPPSGQGVKSSPDTSKWQVQLGGERRSSSHTGTMVTDIYWWLITHQALCCGQLPAARGVGAVAALMRDLPRRGQVPCQAHLCRREGILVAPVEASTGERGRAEDAAPGIEGLRMADAPRLMSSPRFLAFAGEGLRNQS